MHISRYIIANENCSYKDINGSIHKFMKNKHYKVATSNNEVLLVMIDGNKCYMDSKLDKRFHLMELY